MRIVLTTAIAGLYALSLAGVAGAQPSAPAALPKLIFSCGPVEEADRLALSRIEQAEPSPERRAQDLAAGRQAARKAQEIHRAVLAGESAPEPYDSVAFDVRRAKEATDPRLAELFRRVANDQLVRFDRIAGQAQEAWASGLSDAAWQYAYFLVRRAGCGTDEANTQWLKAQLSEVGWFTISRFGAGADDAAFLLVQHADRDREFQSEVLAKLEPLAAAGETRKRNYAYLYDRVARARGGLQRFGTQGRCTGPGTWEPAAVEAPEQLDARRAAMDLPPEAEYQTDFKVICAGGPG